MIINNEQRLWQKVVEQARTDLMANTENYSRFNVVNERRRAREAVINWIGSNDFVEVVKLAGLDVDKLLEEFIELRRRV